MSLAENISNSLGGISNGDGFLVKCVCHEDEKPSLSVKDSIDKDGNPDVTVFCHAGCNWLDIKDQFVSMGLMEKWTPTKKTSTQPITTPAKPAANQPPAEKGGTWTADFIWNKAKTNDDDVEKFLANRSIKYRSEILPASPAIRVGEYKGNDQIVFAMTKPGDKKVIAVQRLSFNRDTFKKEDKGMMYGGSKGNTNCNGRGVYFYRKDNMESLIVGEGVDTVIHRGKKMWVNEILEQGVEEYINIAGLFVAGVRAVISACNVMENGQVIRRAPRYIEDQWFHE